MIETSVQETGKLALVDAAKRLQALSLVREGRLYDLGHVLDEQAPVFPGRYFRQTLVSTAATAAALVAAAVLSVVVYPLLALAVLRREKPAPGIGAAAVADT